MKSLYPNLAPGDLVLVRWAGCGEETPAEVLPFHSWHDDNSHVYVTTPNGNAYAIFVKPFNEYHAKADAFLAKHGLKFRATLSNSKPAPFDANDRPGSNQEDRNHYRVTLSRPWIVTAIKGSTHAGRPTRLTFDFWGSINDARANRHPHAYDVLVCISGDAHCPESFKDFCAEYGYNSDSIKDLQTFRRINAFAKRLRAFFTADELAALAEIQ